MTELKYTYYSDVKEAKVDWLWYPYIPYGKITLLQGDPGEGKSTFILNVASLLTRGKDMPDGYPNKKAEIVIYQCNEDGAADTIKPRLIKAGADCSKMVFIDESEAAVTIDDSRIEEVIVKTKARLLILDPIQSFIPQDTDMQSAGKMRSILTKLANIARKYNCAVVLVGHLNKSQSGKSLYRGLGSIDIPAVARSVLMVERDEETPSIRYVHQIKASLAEEGKSITFSLGGKSGFRWIAESELSLLVGAMSIANKMETAKKLLISALSNGELPCAEIYELSQCLGISEKTVKNAKKELGIKSRKIHSVWYWYLPNDEEVQ